MNADFLKKLNAIPEEEPDEIDLAMIRLSEAEDDGSLVPLEDFMKSLEAYSGKVHLRIPRSLHKRLVERARIEGVSLNQYALYKLSGLD